MFKIGRIAALAAALLVASSAWAGPSFSSGGRSSFSSGGFSSSRSSAPSPSFSSSSSSSSSSFSRSQPSSSGGFSSKAVIGTGAAVGAASAVSTSSSSSASSTTAPKASSTPAPKASAFDASVNRSFSSQAYQARQTPAFKAAVGDKVYTPTQVQTVRTNYYTTVYRDHYVPPMMGHSYGSFSEGFMWAMMFNAVFAHNHSDDPSYIAWRRDAEQRAATDQKVKDQLAELDKKVKELEGQPKDKNYLPKDVPPEVVFSEDALTSRASHPIWTWLFVLAALGTLIGIFVWIDRKTR